MKRAAPFLLLLPLSILAAYLAYTRIRESRWQGDYDAACQALAEYRYPDARARFDAAVRLARSFRARDPRLARSLLGRGFVALEETRGDEAGPLFEEARSLLSGPQEHESPEMADCLCGLAIVAGNRGDNTGAAALLEQALPLRRRRAATQAVELARTLGQFAVVRGNQGQYAEAERLAREALDIWQKVRGPDDPDVAMIRCNLAAALRDQGRLAEARPILTRAAELVERSKGPEFVGLSYVLANLGRLEALETRRNPSPLAGSRSWKRPDRRPSWPAAWMSWRVSRPAVARRPSPRPDSGGPWPSGKAPSPAIIRIPPKSWSTSPPRCGIPAASTRPGRSRRRPAPCGAGWPGVPMRPSRPRRRAGCHDGRSSGHPRQELDDLLPAGLALLLDGRDPLVDPGDGVLMRAGRPR